MSMDPSARDVSDTETAGAVVRPPALFLAALLIGFALDYLLPLPFAAPGTGSAYWISATIGGLLILIGIATFAAAIRNFTSAGTPVQGTQPTRTLVTSGIHGWSRNPIYVGMFLIYVGIGIAALSSWILILTLPVAIIMRYGVVAREEAYLERRFGEDYRNYKARVRRWL
jgi:protein-S-isoprenylcysteine O-methyltransferase Ste14